MNDPTEPMPSAPWSRADRVAALWLLACAALLAEPLLHGGAASYLDNPVHLAEIAALAASPSAWVDIGFCGAPIGTLHSPLWTGLLVAAVRLGLPLLPVYSALLVAALAAPALALFAGARRWLSTPAAALAGYALLVQRPGLAGVESPLGGMYPFYFGMALCLWLAFALSRPSAALRAALARAALVAVIGLTHTFALLVAGLLGATALLGLGWRRRWRQAAALTGALLLGAAASALYWLQPLLDGQATQRTPQNLSADWLLRLLWFPHDLVAMLGHRPGADWRLGGVDAVAMAALLAAGLAAAALQLRGLWRRAPVEPLASLGLGLSAALAGLLFFVLPGTALPWLGPVSWRFLYPLRLGAALAATPLLARWPALRRGAPRPGRTATALAALTLAGLCPLWATPLRDEVAAADGAELAEVEDLWRALATLRQPDWGRVYLQNTYQTAPLQRTDGAPARLAHAHVLALTSQRSGVRQLGPYYGVTPYATDWTASAHDTLFGVPTRQPRVYRHTALWLGRTGCSHLVLADPGLVAGFVAAGLEPLWRGGRFTVLQVPRAQWPARLEGNGASATVDARQPHQLRVRLHAHTAPAEVRLPHAWSAHWQLDPPGVAALRRDKMGLVVLGAIAVGEADLTLRYAPPRLGEALSAAAWLVWVALSLWRWRRGDGQRSRRPPSSRFHAVNPGTA